MKRKSSGSKYDKIFRRISSGKSFSDIGSLAIADGSEHMPFLRLYDSNADATCTW